MSQGQGAKEANFKPNDEFTSEEIRFLKQTTEQYENNFFRLSYKEIVNRVSIDFEMNHKIEKVVKEIHKKLHHKFEIGNFAAGVDYPSEALIKVNESVNGECKKFRRKLKKMKKKVKNDERKQFIGVNIIGSFLLRSCTKMSYNVDIGVTIPEEILMEGQSDGIYFLKRYWFLEYLNRRLDGFVFNKKRIQFHYQFFKNDDLKPIIVSTFDCGVPCSINIYPLLEEETGILKHSPTAVREDAYFAKHLKVLHGEFKEAPNIIETIVLLKVWLRQRKVTKSFRNIDGFFISVIIFHLLKTRVIRISMSSFLIMKNFFAWVVENDWKIPIFEPTNHENTDSIVFFGEAVKFAFFEEELFFRVTQNEMDEFITESKIANELLIQKSYAGVDVVESLFLSRHVIYEKVDILLKISVKEDNMSWDGVLDLLSKALRSVICYAFRITVKDPRCFCVGLVLNPHWDEEYSVYGPILDSSRNTPEMKEKISEFRSFWGERVKIVNRGSSLQLSIEWDCSSLFDVVNKISAHILERHFDIPPECVVVLGSHIFKCLEVDKYRKLRDDSFREVKNEIEKLNEKIQLYFGEITAVSPCMRGTSLFQKKRSSYIVGFIKECTESQGVIRIDKRKMPKPINVVVEFQKNRNWPKELEAIERVKKIIFVRMSKELPFRVSVHNDWIDIFHTNGFVFRIMFLVKSENLLRIGSRTENIASKIKVSPLHHRWINSLSEKYSGFSDTVRFVKKWANKHLFDGLLSEEFLEILVAHIFTKTDTYLKPKFQFNGFVRFLKFITSFSFGSNLLFVNFGGEMSDEEQNQLEEIHTQYGLLEKKPHVSVVVSYLLNDWDYFCGDNCVEAVVFRRLIHFARTSFLVMEKMINYEASIYDSLVDWNSLFQTSFSTFDMVLEIRRKQSDNFHDLEFHPVEIGIEMLRNALNKYGTVFLSEEDDVYIAGILWNANKFRFRSISFGELGYSFPLLGEQELSSYSVPNIFDIIKEIKKIVDVKVIFNLENNRLKECINLRKRKR